MKRFARLYEALDETTSTRRKVEAIRSYMAAVDPVDGAWAVFILSGERLRRLVGRRALRDWVMDASGLPDWLVDECSTQVGDTAETAALLCADRPGRPNDTAPVSTASVDEQQVFAFDESALVRADRRWRALDASSPLHHWFDRGILPLRELRPDHQGERVRHWWSRLPMLEAFLLTKLMTGGLRVGVSRTLLVRGLAACADLPTEIVAHRLMGPWSPSADAFRAVLAPVDPDAGGVGDDRPYPFFLASPIDAGREPDGTAAAEADDGSDRDDEPGDVASTPAERLGPIDAWQVEWKWDGIRAQIVWRGDAPRIWSRGEEEISAAFPELVAAAARLPRGVVLDGELVAWRDDEPLGFALLQRRLGRRAAGPRVQSAAPVAFLAFDLLEERQEDRRRWPLSRRRAALEALLSGAPAAGGTPRLRLSPELRPADWSAAEARRRESRARRVEGLMLKRRDSEYGVGRVRGAWWKWKIEPFTVDAVLIHAQAGHGRRATLYTDYTFALWHDGALTPVARAYSGLDDREIDELDRWIRAHTRERFGPVRAVDPELVFELGFEGVQPSSRHRSGLAVRFPRILRWRRDKSAAEADHLESLRAML